MPSLRPRGEEQEVEPLESGRVEECTDALSVRNTENSLQIITHWLLRKKLCKLWFSRSRREILVTISLLPKLTVILITHLGTFTFSYWIITEFI